MRMMLRIHNKSSAEEGKRKKPTHTQSESESVKMKKKMEHKQSKCWSLIKDEQQKREIPRSRSTSKLNAPNELNRMESTALLMNEKCFCSNAHFRTRNENSRQDSAWASTMEKMPFVRGSVECVNVCISIIT